MMNMNALTLPMNGDHSLQAALLEFRWLLFPFLSLGAMYHRIVKKNRIAFCYISNNRQSEIQDINSVVPSTSRFCVFFTS
jgi:hypothetical protein